MNFHICTFHKCGSNWFRDLFMSLAEQLGYDYVPVVGNTEPTIKKNQPVRRGGAGAFVIHPGGRRGVVREQRAAGEKTVFCIRDPRDAIVSQYFSWRESHWNNNEAILAARQRLQALSPRDGIASILEHDQFAFGKSIRRWKPVELAGDDVMLWRYEDLLADTAGQLRRLLAFLAIPAGSVDIDKIVKRHSFEAKARRDRGTEDTSSNLRKGIAGDHKNHFDAALTSDFQQRFGDVMTLLGYQ